MTIVRFAILVGLIIGAVWALAGFEGALLTAGLGLVGLLIALVIEGRVDFDFLGQRERR
ncbi:MAG: hypothetical protein M3N51_03410 [Actinomycetota bacterium]|jgi:hypothetical protein|nr:hypothetical protein [Actinomycetota bacterium]